jgi:hypothetical protein
LYWVREKILIGRVNVFKTDYRQVRFSVVFRDCCVSSLFEVVEVEIHGPNLNCTTSFNSNSEKTGHVENGTNMDLDICHYKTSVSALVKAYIIYAILINRN